ALVRIARLGAELFHDPEGNAYATIEVDGHAETWPVRSKGFKRWLGHRYYEDAERVPSSGAINDALGVVEGRACYEGPEEHLHVRVARHEGRIYYDLCDERWRVVEIGPDGWRVLDRSPVRFRRPKGMRAAPAPERGGSMGMLLELLNCGEDEATRAMVLGWLLGALGAGPYLVLIVQGEQGSAKSFTSRLLKQLVDPNKVPLRSPAKEDRDLAIAASNSW